MFSNDFFGRLRPEVRARRRRAEPSRRGPRSRRLRLEPLEERRLLSLGAAPPTLPGMHLADPSVDRFDGQIVYLDFDGARDVTYNGPVVIEGIDVPAFRLPGALAGQEEAVIAGLVDVVEGVFGDCGITVTTQTPSDGQCSTVYVGGDDSAFGEYGSFLGLAEQTDVGNSDHGDSAFVFSEAVLAAGGVDTLSQVTVHEVGHLLGYAHKGDDAGEGSELAAVAHKGGTHKFITEQACHLYGALFGVSGVELELDSYRETIKKGAKEEDDPWHAMPFLRHFCAGADREGDYDELKDGYSDYDSAFTRATGHYATAKDKYSTETESAYWWFGRTVHLLQDMCVPAHVHNDPHGGLIGGDDQYEDYAANAEDATSYFKFDAQANGTSWNYQEWVDGKWTVPASYWSVTSGPQALWDRSDDYADLEALFRETTDYTDDYDSDDRNGDYHNDKTGDEFPVDRLEALDRWLHASWADTVGKNTGELSGSECRRIARDLGTWAVEQSVMLMRFFYNSVGQLVSTPTNFQAQGISSSSIKLDWESVEGADGYVVYRSTNPTTGFSRAGSSTEPSYTDEGLAPDTDYFYHIYAYNDVAGLGSGYAGTRGTCEIVVSILEDEDDGNYGPKDLSLREALRLAAEDPGKDVIRFATGLAGGTMNLGSQLLITSNVDLLGLGVTIKAPVNSRVLEVTDAVTDATIRDLTITGGSAQNGGGILNQGTLSVITSTISGNSADESGGGVFNQGTLTVLHSTISGNSARDFGGGIVNQGTLTVLHSTIADNTADADADQSGAGGGVHTEDGRSTTLQNTIVAGNVLADPVEEPPDDLSGNVNAADSWYNLVGDAGSSGGLADGVNGNLVGQDPLLAPLGNYGGARQTHALLVGSPAIDAGDPLFDPNAFDPPLVSDQRGQGFARVAGSAVDIGAWEFQLVVSTLVDEQRDDNFLWGHVSLREALSLAADNPGKDVIRFAPELGGTITLDPGLGQLSITSDLDLLGMGVTVDALGNSRVLEVTGEDTQATLRDLTITGGRAEDGGGILNQGTLSLVNSTISGNAALRHGGGVFNESTLRAVNSTIAANTADAAGSGSGNGGGIHTADGGSTTLHNTIVASNVREDPSGPGTVPDDLSRNVEVEVEDSWHNLVGDGGSGGLADGVNGNLVGRDPRLAPLGKYGGRPQTHALLPDSPAIDAGDPLFAPNAFDPPMVTDQRGEGFDRIVGDAVDIGAFERQPFVVSTLEDENDGDYRWGRLSLREALVLAASVTGKDAIRFAPHAAGGTINLDSELMIESDVDLMGSGVTLDAQRNSHVLMVADAVTDATISDLTITRGYTTQENGGGILNQGTLRVVNSTISDSFAWEDGGGIWNASTGVLVVENSTISGNSANVHGGGICNAGRLSVLNSTIDNNIADVDATAGRGRGGGIFNSGTLWVLNSTISRNSTAYIAGGINVGSGSDATVVNSTISGNEANGVGGGVYNYGNLCLVNSTIAENTADKDNSGDRGGGFYTPAGGLTTLHNSIVARNFRAATADDFCGAVDPDSSYNLVGDAATGGGLANGVNGNLVGAVDLSWLLELGDYGGPTQTHALLPDGPAINAGDNGQARYWDGQQYVPLTTDQRGEGFARILSGVVDIGAFESQVIVVSTFLDEDDQDHSPGDLSLREALGLAAEHPGRDVIRFIPELAGAEIVLDADLGQLQITSDLDLMGMSVTIHAPGNCRVLEVTAAVTDATLRDLTITGGSADDGGGILNQGTLSLLNATISGNSADESGGGVFNDGMLCAVNSTIADNTAEADDGGSGNGGGIATSSAGSTTLHNTIVTGNVCGTAAPVADDLSGNVHEDSSHNLVGDAATSGGLNVEKNNLVGVDPRLAPLGKYGGTAQTHALRPDSPAIDAGDDDRAVAPDGMSLTTDERGEGFGRIVGEAVDIGAFERQPFVVSTLVDEDDEDHRPGDLSLREALRLAESNPGKDVVLVAPELAGETITLNPVLGDLHITSDLELNGGGVIVDANGACRVLLVKGAVTDADVEATIRDLTITGGSGSQGGGILNYGTLSVAHSTIEGNSASSFGGGVCNKVGATLRVVNSTISGNSTNQSGGGILNYGTLHVHNSTVAYNTADAEGNGEGDGGGIATFGGGSTMLHNTIVAKNVKNTADSDLWGPVDPASSYNLVGDAGNSGLPAGSNILGQEPSLAALGSYGGLTQTHALLPASPAIDAGDPLFDPDAFGPPLVNDQRGEGLDRVFGSADPKRVDIGAFEFQLIVSTLTDENDTNFQWGALSLREVLSLAAQHPGKDVIQFAPHLASGKITLALGQLQIASDVDLLGMGVTIDAANKWRVFEVTAAVADATISDLTITRGYTTKENGGGILNQGTLRVVNSTISDSFAWEDGGGIWNDSTGVLVVENSTISGNSANIDGGGICSAGTLSVLNSTIDNNIADKDATASRGVGGGICNYASGTLRVLNSTISRNSSLRFTGGIHIVANSSATVVNSTISGNSTSGDGGGILNRGTLEVLNSTIAENIADKNSTGVYHGGGVRTDPGAVTTLHNTIVAGNVRRTDTPQPDDLWGNVDPDSSYNLVGDVATSGGLSVEKNNLVGVDDLSWLLELDDYGGTTQTHALLAGSPAIETGDPDFNPYNFEPPLVNDQRGEGFDRIRGGRLDIGAFELQQNQPPVLSDLSATDVDEGGTSTLSGKITDPDTLDTFTLVVDWGDGSPVETFDYPAGTTEFSETHQYLDDDPSGTASDEYTVTVTVKDDDTGTDTATTTVTVTNVAPVLSDLSATDVDESGTSTLSGTITDPGTQDTFTLVVDWGDGSAAETFSYPAGTTTFSQTHQYLDDDPSGTASDEYTITVTVEDDDTGSDTETTTVAVCKAAAIQASVRDADTGLPADPGEADTVPESLPWIDEWDSFWVEIWGNTPDTTGFGIRSFSLDLVYNTDLFTAATIEYGPAFTEDQPASIDDATGRVANINGSTSQTVGAERNVLLARVLFEPMSCDAGCPHNADGQYVTPVEDLGLAFEEAAVELVGVGQATVQLGASPATDSWPVIYDVDDDGRIAFGDLAYFATAFQQKVGDPGADFAWACDFDHSGKVDVGDLAFFAENFQRAPGSPMVYPGNFPDDWQSSTQQAGAMQATGMQAAGMQELAAAEGRRAPDPVFLSACCLWDFDTLEAASANSSDSKEVEAVDFLIAHGYW